MNLQNDSSETLSSNIVLHIADTASCYRLIVKGGFVGLFVNFYLLGFWEFRMRTVYTLFLAPLLHPVACAPCQSSCLAPVFVDFIAWALRGLPSHYPGMTSQGTQFLHLAVLFSLSQLRKHWCLENSSVVWWATVRMVESSCFVVEKWGGQVGCGGTLKEETCNGQDLGFSQMQQPESVCSECNLLIIYEQ